VMVSQHSDAFVFFGATGDLAYKQIFPALQALIRRGDLDVPIIGVAKSGWTLEQLRARARASVCEHGGMDEAAFAKLSHRLQYIDGDYQDGASFGRLRATLGSATRPLHYLAIPPGMFEAVAEGLARSGCAEDARVVVEKPFGRDLASAQALNRTSSSRRPRSSGSTIISARRRSRTCSTSALPTRSSSRSGTAIPFGVCRSPWRRASACRAGDGSMRRWAPSATSSRTICSR
jgi:hypothetical protein